MNVNDLRAALQEIIDLGPAYTSADDMRDIAVRALNEVECIPVEIYEALKRYEDAHRTYVLDPDAVSAHRALSDKGNALIDAEAELLTAFRRARSRG